MIRHCEECGNPIVITHGNQRYCEPCKEIARKRVAKKFHRRNPGYNTKYARGYDRKAKTPQPVRTDLGGVYMNGKPWR